MRKSISPHKRLTSTLRFLATGWSPAVIRTDERAIIVCPAACVVTTYIRSGQADRLDIRTRWRK